MTDASLESMHPELDELPLSAWNDTRETIHRWSQIIGKIQLALTPHVNHWWNVALSVTPHGIATTTIPYGERCFDLELDFIDDVLRLRTSDGSIWAVPLGPRSVAEVYADTMDCLEDARIAVRISPIPAEIENRIPLDRDFDHHSYDKRYVARFHKAAAWASHVMSEFRGRFLGKSSPVQFYWGHFDLSLSRFSGRLCMTAPPADPIEREAYSHEVFSVGWWAGDERFEKPAFYAYASPEPPGFPVARVPHPALLPRASPRLLSRLRRCPIGGRPRRARARVLPKHLRCCGDAGRMGARRARAHVRRRR